VSFAFTDSDENLKYEEFLCFRPGRLTPVLTTERGKAFTDEEIDRIVADEGEIPATSYLCEDVFRVADRLREWSGDDKALFPTFLHSEPGTSPVALTRVKMACLPAIDRIWHTEWPVRLELRPASLREQLRQELAYWRRVNDAMRADLVEERLSELGAADRKDPIKGPA